jgi:hypothetical protein
MADRSFDVQVDDNSGLDQQLLSLGFVVLGHLIFNVGQRRENPRVDGSLGLRTHNARQINTPYIFLVPCGNVARGNMASPITQTHRCYAYMHYLLRFTNTRVKPCVYEENIIFNATRKLNKQKAEPHVYSI